jgi:D-glycero-alpha-D-manno-heptose-7-phosphate kinase
MDSCFRRNDRKTAHGMKIGKSDMSEKLSDILKLKPIEASVPCRIDMGGTLDISTFYYPLRQLNPCTFNIAIDLRTRVRIFPYDQGRVKISSRGFESAEFPFETMPFDHPMGLMFAIAAYFGADGIHIAIDSASPPRSALGGSSSAAVAIIGAFSKLLEQTGKTPFSREAIAILAHEIEESVAGVPCGLQDQLAAVYGGVNAWHWPAEIGSPVFRQQPVIEKENFKELERRILLAYCGIPHESRDINGRWVRQFLSGRYRDIWAEIITCTQNFVDALSKENYKAASEWMNRETEIRRKLTPDVLDQMGEKLAESAMKNRCGARFTGAGGGGCLWAVGEAENIDSLRKVWKELLSKREGACLLDAKTDAEGLKL